MAQLLSDMQVWRLSNEPDSSNEVATEASNVPSDDGRFSIYDAVSYAVGSKIMLMIPHDRGIEDYISEVRQIAASQGVMLEVRQGEFRSEHRGMRVRDVIVIRIKSRESECTET